MLTTRERKSSFVKLFDKTAPQVMCPHFYELVLSNGCPYRCDYCYLRLTFRGNTRPTVFDNDWAGVQEELEQVDKGVFSTGELADSLAVIPPLLPKALDYFADQKTRSLLLVTKSADTSFFEARESLPTVIVSFSVNSTPAAKLFEKGAPSPTERLRAAARLKALGWRLRIRLDPIILETGIEHYEEVCKAIADLDPERVTIGSLRQYPGVHRFSPQAPRVGLEKADDGRMRYAVEVRSDAYRRIAEWLGFQPALCKETHIVWKALKWRFSGCNCTE